MKTLITVALVVLCAAEAQAAPKRKRPNKQQQELIEQSRKNKEAAEKAQQTADEAKRSAEDAKKQLSEGRAADDARRAEDAAKRAAEEQKRAEDARVAEEARRKAEGDKLAAEEAAKQAAALKAEQDRQEAERKAIEAKLEEERAYTHVFYLRAHAGTEMYQRRLFAGGTGLGFAPAFGGGFGYRLGLVRLGLDYQATLALSQGHWHKLLFNTELVLGTRLVEFVIRVGLGYGLLSTNGAGLRHGGAGKGGLGLDFRVTPAFAVGIAADFDCLIFFNGPAPRFPFGATGVGRISIFL